MPSGAPVLGSSRASVTVIIVEKGGPRPRLAKDTDLAAVRDRDDSQRFRATLGSARP
jgi:hypothetical protein